MIQRFPKYQLRYTRLFEQDLMRAAQYIDQVLDNPTAAQKLVDDTEKAILERLNRMPQICRAAGVEYHQGTVRKGSFGL